MDLRVDPQSGCFESGAFDALRHEQADLFFAPPGGLLGPAPGSFLRLALGVRKLVAGVEVFVASVYLFGDVNVGLFLGLRLAVPDMGYDFAEVGLLVRDMAGNATLGNEVGAEDDELVRRAGDVVVVVLLPVVDDGGRG